MDSMIEMVRETFTLFLAASIAFSLASIWAAVKALRTTPSDRHRQD